ncbi:MAG: hypothetical protein GY835_08720 [bacterium]|nr:hypothetical protein [bacterium]
MQRLLITSLLIAMTIAAPATAVQVKVEIDAWIEYNQIPNGPFSEAQAEDLTTVTFLIDSDNFIDSSSYNLRAYEIERTSFELAFGPATAGLMDPLTDTPYFVVRDGDPVADGFCLTMGDIDWPIPPLLDQVGMLDNLACAFEVGYSGETLGSLDIVDAVGIYDYDGLTNYYHAILDGGMEAAALWFTEISISLVTTATTATSWSELKSLY